MKNIINDKKIENILNSFKPNESISLSYNEKKNILASVFEKVEKKSILHTSIKSPFDYKSYFVQYLRYSIPVILIAVIGTQAAGLFSERSQIALNDMNEIKSSLSDLKREKEIKSNLTKNKQDIQEIKTLALSEGGNMLSSRTAVLANQVSKRSKEIRNQVASLVSENKITEAKNIALDLETALKADELYKVSTSVEREVFMAIDLRVDIEKKESNNISSTTEATVSKRIDIAKKDIVDIENIYTSSRPTVASVTPLSSDIDTTVESTSTTATTSNLVSTTTKDIVTDMSPIESMIFESKKSIETSEKYLKDKDFGNAIISLQLHDRILAELKNILLP